MNTILVNRILILKEFFKLRSEKLTSLTFYLAIVTLVISIINLILTLKLNYLGKKLLITCQICVENFKLTV